MADQQVPVALVANDEGVPLLDQRSIEFAAIAATIHDPDAAAVAGGGHRADRGHDLVVLGDEVGRILRVERSVERHDGVILVLDADHMGEPVAIGDGTSRAVTHARKVLHLLRVRLCDIGKIEDQQRTRADLPGALREHRVTDRRQLGPRQIP